MLGCGSSSVKDEEIVAHKFKRLIVEWEAAWVSSFGEEITTENKKNLEGAIYNNYKNLKHLGSELLKLGEQGMKLGKGTDEVGNVSVYSKDIMLDDSKLVKKLTRLGDGWKDLIHKWIEVNMKRIEPAREMTR